MKKIFKNLGGALMLAAALVFTSCDQIKSFMDNPVSSHLEVNPESVTLKVGEEKALEVTTISDQPITYTSSNADVATVNAKGVITAVSEGDAIITVSVASTNTYAAGTKQVQVKVEPAPIHTIPLTIEAKAENGATVSLKKYDASLELEKTIKYKKSTDTSWSDYAFDGQNGDEISLNQGESVSFWSNNAALAQKQDEWTTFYSQFVIDGECYVYGNVMSMIDDQEGATAENPKFSTDEEIGGSCALYYLFGNCTKILNHESKELVLPATTLASYCYQKMFYGCSLLTKAPELKAETLKERCYQDMFSYCTSLEEAPEIAAETVARYCCGNMFYRCTSLTKGPVLKAKTLENFCYNNMFMYCEKLGSLTCLATDISAYNCVNSWLDNAGTQAEGDKKLYVDPSMTGADWKFQNGSGWTATAVPAVD